MAHTEECRGCSCENRCDFIRCTKEIEKEIRAKAIDEFVEALLNYQPQDEDYKSFSDVCYEVAEKLKGGAE